MLGFWSGTLFKRSLKLERMTMALLLSSFSVRNKPPTSRLVSGLLLAHIEISFTMLAVWWKLDCQEEVSGLLDRI